jgi:hypothetical protein
LVKRCPRQQKTITAQSGINPPCRRLKRCIILGLSGGKTRGRSSAKNMVN